MPAAPREGILYLNVGEFMERFSNGESAIPLSSARSHVPTSEAGLFPSAMHRVSIRPTHNGEATIPGRLSIPFFTMIDSSEPINPMPSRVKADGKANFETMSYQDLVARLYKMLD